MYYHTVFSVVAGNKHTHQAVTSGIRILQYRIHAIAMLNEDSFVVVGV